MKQKLSLLLALCMLGGLLAGCGQKDDGPDTSGAAGDISGGAVSTPEDGSAAGSQAGTSQPDTPPEMTVAPETAGTEMTSTITHDGVDYATITLSGHLDSEQGEFTMEDGEVYNWYYNNVALGSTYTFTPVPCDDYKYAALLIYNYEVEDGVYMSVPWGIRHRLYADGQVEDGVFWDAMENLPLPTADHPAYFTFGENPDAASPFGGEAPMGDPFEFKADGTMYRLDVNFFDENEEYVYGYFDIFFVK